MSMRTWPRTVSAMVGAVTAAALVTGCNGLPAKSAGPASPPARPGAKKTFRMGEESWLQESQKTDSKDAKYTVTPQEVRTGTQTDLDNSGLEKDDKDGPQVPVFVRSTLTHKSGTPMKLGDMDGDLMIRTESGLRTRALIVLMGRAKWNDCPSTPSEKTLAPGQSEKICTAFLIPAGQKPAAVELFRGFNAEPWEWPLAG
ncbi:hypothetical protein Slala03_71750 [Streptomyces lavendulae subsp. lavendulae]|uniref:hypothetical protein n=1 Tax=Streptomyces lavendulae TaxID=1914 RepID=UPI0024A5DE5C|nr:hypothetical protein [Streptomyces lavendulae]GLV87486.1 hypothetical protein Slala03_71750 [Streptomyces lavendulae subsp. lavendulae]